MTYSSVTEASQDPDVVARMRAAISHIAFSYLDIRDTYYGERVRMEGPDVVLDLILWNGSVLFEAQYMAALASGNPRPAIDPAFLTDEALYAGIALYLWPADP